MATADLQRLLVVDRVWTGAEQNAGDFTDRDRESLYGLGRRLDQELGLAESHAVMLAEFFATFPAWVNHRVGQELVDSAIIGPHHREGIRRVLKMPDNDFAAKGGAAAATVAQRAPSERVEVRRKTNPLRGAGPVVTDISLQTWCGIAASGLVADLAVCPETLGVGCAAAVGIYYMMDSAGC